MSRPDFIETFTGKRFRPLAPVAADIDIRDIAHALSQQCRFSGHTIAPYSVAEHSVRVCRLLHEWGCSRMVQMWGLLHDASEAYLVDIPSPLKAQPAFAAYLEAEVRLMAAVCERFDLYAISDGGELRRGGWLPPDVARADAVLLSTEARDLMPFRPEHWAGLTAPPLYQSIVPWPSTWAEREFLRAFEALQ